MRKKTFIIILFTVLSSQITAQIQVNNDTVTFEEDNFSISIMDFYGKDCFLCQENEGFSFHFFTPYATYNCGDDIILPMFFSLKFPSNYVGCWHNNRNLFMFFFGKKQYLIMEYDYIWDYTYSTDKRYKITENKWVDTTFFAGKEEFLNHWDWSNYIDLDIYCDTVFEKLPCTNNIWARRGNVVFKFINISDLEYENVLESFVIHRNAKILVRAQNKCRVLVP